MPGNGGAKRQHRMRVPRVRRADLAAASRVGISYRRRRIFRACLTSSVSAKAAEHRVQLSSIYGLLQLIVADGIYDNGVRCRPFFHAEMASSVARSVVSHLSWQAFLWACGGGGIFRAAGNLFK